MNIRQILGVVGGFITLLGIFTPLLLNFSAFNNGSILGVSLIFLSVNSIILALAEKFKAVLVLGFLSVIFVTEEFIRLNISINAKISELRSQLSDNPFGGLAELVYQNFGMKWGWIVLFTGTLMILTSGLLKNNTVTINA